MRSGSRCSASGCSISWRYTLSILVQHGWGKTTKIQQALGEESVAGVIMSPRDELPPRLAEFLSEIAHSYPQAERLVDPQLYAGTITQPRDGQLQHYPHYESDLSHSSFSPEGIRHFVNISFNWQRDLDVTAMVSPSILIEDFFDRAAQIAIMLSQEAQLQHNRSQDKPLFVSLVVSEAALRNRAALNSWLNEISQIDVDGFYLILQRGSDTYSQQYQPEVLAALMGICYSLSEINEYRVVVGYTDMATLLLHAVGVDATAAGWSVGLRQFTLRRFLPVTGGRQPRPRYSSGPLTNSIFVTDLEPLYNAGRIAEVLSDTPYDSRFNGNTNPENVPWPAEEAALHHWHVLSNLARLTAAGRIGERLDRAEGHLGQAIAQYSRIAPLVPFTSEGGATHLHQWLEALNSFRSEFAV